MPPPLEGKLTYPQRARSVERAASRDKVHHIQFILSTVNLVVLVIPGRFLRSPITRCVFAEIIVLVLHYVTVTYDRPQIRTVRGIYIFSPFGRLLDTPHPID